MLLSLIYLARFIAFRCTRTCRLSGPFSRGSFIKERNTVDHENEREPRGAPEFFRVGHIVLECVSLWSEIFISFQLVVDCLEHTFQVITGWCKDPWQAAGTTETK